MTNMISCRYTLIPTSAILGLGGAPLWSAKCTYLTIAGNIQAGREGKRGSDVINQYFGIFFFIFQSSAVWGNLMSSLIFGQDTDIGRAMIHSTRKKRKKWVKIVDFWWSSGKRKSSKEEEASKLNVLFSWRGFCIFLPWNLQQEQHKLCFIYQAFLVDRSVLEEFEQRHVSQSRTVWNQEKIGEFHETYTVTASSVHDKNNQQKTLMIPEIEKKNLQSCNHFLFGFW